MMLCAQALIRGRLQVVSLVERLCGRAATTLVGDISRAGMPLAHLGPRIRRRGLSSEGLQENPLSSARAARYAWRSQRVA